MYTNMNENNNMMLKNKWIKDKTTFDCHYFDNFLNFPIKKKKKKKKWVVGLLKDSPTIIIFGMNYDKSGWNKRWNTLLYLLFKSNGGQKYLYCML